MHYSSCSLFYHNAGGMRSKVSDFCVAAVDCPYSIIALTETWLSEDINSSELLNTDYEVFRKDRCKTETGLSRGGGAVRSCLKSKQIQLNFSSGLIEQ